MRNLLPWTSFIAIVAIAVCLAGQGIQPMGNDNGDTIEASYQQMVGK